MLSSIAEARVGISQAPRSSACRHARPASRTRSAIADSAGVALGAASPGDASGCALTIRFIAALAVEHHLARAVARHRHEAHRLQHRAERLRLRGGVLDELDAVHAERIGGLGLVLVDAS